MGYLQEIQGFAERIIYDGLDTFWAKIERGHWRQDDTAHLRDLCHQLQMAEMEGRFPYD